MEQRRLRLGDILDDYCPRERRVTNHAVVAMIDETVKQTRCTTCDAEHPYKGGQAPRRRKKEGTSALFKEVLAGKGDKETEDIELGASAVPDLRDDLLDDAHDDALDGPHDDAPDSTQDDVYPDEGSSPTLMADTDMQPEADSSAVPREDGPVHRQLIRATLPRIEGFKEERRPTDFTIRQPGGRGGNNPGNHFRGNGGNDRSRHGRGGHGATGGSGGFGGNANRGNSNRSHGGQRFAQRGQGQGQGQGRGQGQGGQGGFRSSQQPRHGGGRKRSR
jgi:hypothetical protein